MRNAVWAYWEDKPGSTRAPYLDLCVETIRRQSEGLEFELLGRNDLAEWIPDLDGDVWDRLPNPIYRSDYARSRLLLHHGGIWVDVDTIAVSPLSRLLEILDGHGFVSWGREIDHCYINLMAAKPGSPIIEAWVQAQDRVLCETQDWEALSYPELGQQILQPLSRKMPWRNMPIERVAPIIYDRWRQFLSPHAAPRRILRSDPYVVTLWNAAMGPALRDLQADQLLESHSLLGRLLRIGLGISNVGQERPLTDVLPRLRYSTNGVRVETRLRRWGIVSTVYCARDL